MCPCSAYWPLNFGSVLFLKTLSDTIYMYVLYSVNCEILFICTSPVWSDCFAVFAIGQENNPDYDGLYMYVVGYLV